MEKTEAGPMAAASFRGNLGGGGQWFNRKGPFLSGLGPFGARQGPESTNRRCTILSDAAWLALVLVPSEESRFALWAWLAGSPDGQDGPCFCHLPAAN